MKARLGCSMSRSGRRMRRLVPLTLGTETGDSRVRCCPGVAVGSQRASMEHGGGQREQLDHDVHAAEEEPLLPLHLCLVHDHPMEALARELPAAALDEAEMARQAAEVAVAERATEPAEP